jgi:hypothetical protein
MSVRQTILVAVVAAIVSACCAFTISQAAQPNQARAGKSSAVLKELKKLNRAIGKPVGGFDDVTPLLADIREATDETCQSVSSTPSFCH